MPSDDNTSHDTIETSGATTHATRLPAARTSPLVVTAARVAATLTRLRERRPRIHSLTSTVAQNFTANMLLAVGATPSMTDSPEEVPAFVASADGLLVNIGMLDRAFRNAVLTAIEVAKDSGVPWSLDPVMIDISPPRMEFARRLMDMDPALVHANRAEFAALAGVEASDDEVRDSAVRALTTMAVTGEVDIITDGKRVVRVANGHPLMDRVTAVGCAGFAVATAFRAVEPDPVIAATSAFVAMGVAGELAATVAHGPGSFAIAFLDALHSLDEETILNRAKIR